MVGATAEAYERDPIVDHSSDEKLSKWAKKRPSLLEEKVRTKKVREMSRKRNFWNSGGSRTFPNGSSFSNVQKSPGFSPCICAL